MTTKESKFGRFSAGKGADGPMSGVAKEDNVFQLLKSAHEDLKEARSCVVGTIQQLAMVDSENSLTVN